MEVLSKISKDTKIFISGIAGLVGQNLALRLSQAGYTQISGLDKHPKNLKILQSYQPNLTVKIADIAEMGDWSDMVKEAEVVIINQAQIGGLDYEDFHRNNVSATQSILDSINQEKKSLRRANIVLSCKFKCG